MNSKILISLLFISLPVAGAWADGSSGKSPAETEAAIISLSQSLDKDIITPLNVRDPSALVMGPRANAPAVAIEPPPAAPACAPGAGGVGPSTFDKAGPAAGKRAVAVSIGEDQLLDVKVGDRVDLIGVLEVVTSTRSREMLSATILQNVRILGIAHAGSLLGKGVLSLELNPIEAQYAHLAANQTVLGLSRRAASDSEMHPFEMSSLREMFR
jgi:hypothetical protein